MNDIAKQIGRRIRIQRAVQNLTQAKLAQAIGITQAQLSYLERGERTLHTETLARIAAALACEPTDLINERHRLA